MAASARLGRYDFLGPGNTTRHSSCRSAARLGLNLGNLRVAFQVAVQVGAPNSTFHSQHSLSSDFERREFPLAFEIPYFVKNQSLTALSIFRTSIFPSPRVPSLKLVQE